MCDGLFRNDRNDRVCYKNECAILFLHLLTVVYKHLPSVNGSMAHSAFLYLIDSSKVSSIIRLEGIWSKRVFWMHWEIPLHLPFRHTLRRTSQSKVFPHHSYNTYMPVFAARSHPLGLHIALHKYMPAWRFLPRHPFFIVFLLPRLPRWLCARVWFSVPLYSYTWICFYMSAPS